MVNRFHLSDKGAKDKHSVTGYAAPSWHTFTHRVWERETGAGDTHWLTLRNLTNTEGWRPLRAIAQYEVGITDRRNAILYLRVGTDWNALVREAKQWSYDHDRVKPIPLVAPRNVRDNMTP
jgi:hypothetical protein